jgi:hypothetical protein
MVSIHTVYDLIFGDLPAKNAVQVYTIFVWFSPNLVMSSLCSGSASAV